MSALTRFLGDSPLRVVLKLVVLSFIVGLVMNAFHWTPWDIYYALEDAVVYVWNMGFAALGRFFGYILLGAAVVIPVFLILRIISYRN